MLHYFESCTETRCLKSLVANIEIKNDDTNVYFFLKKNNGNNRGNAMFSDRDSRFFDSFQSFPAFLCDIELRWQHGMREMCTRTKVFCDHRGGGSWCIVVHAISCMKAAFVGLKGVPALLNTLRNSSPCRPSVHCKSNIHVRNLN